MGELSVGEPACHMAKPEKKFISGKVMFLVSRTVPEKVKVLVVQSCPTLCDPIY